jgi:hypothetical protein
MVLLFHGVFELIDRLLVPSRPAPRHVQTALSRLTESILELDGGEKSR